MRGGLFRRPAAGEGSRADEPADHIHTAEHLGRRPAREGQKQNSARIDAASNQPGNAMHKRGGLAGASAGHDQ